MKYILLFILFFISTSFSPQQNEQKPRRMLSTYYDDWFEGKTTSSGHIFSQKEYTAAHLTIPLGTFLRVENPQNNRWVIVLVNDRCPKRGVLDLTKAAAEQLDFIKDGVIKVETYPFPNSLYALWEFQNTLFKYCPECSFEEWKKLAYFVTGTKNFSKKPYSKKLKKAPRIIYNKTEKDSVNQKDSMLLRYEKIIDSLLVNPADPIDLE